MQSLLYFVVALSLLIVIHEYGHFWVARRNGVKVLRFSIGFGKPLWSWLGKDGTEYVIAPIPLGGYVKMLDEREGEVAEADRSHSFNRQSLAVRAAIVAAGPIANLLFAVLAFWFLFVIGIPGIKPIIDHVQPGSIAEQAGLKAGDELVSIDSESTPTWTAVIQILLPIAEHGGYARVGVSTDGSISQHDVAIAQVALDKTPSVLSHIGITPLRPKLVPVIGEVMDNQAAALAGIEVGDELIAADGVRIDDWADWVALIQESPNTPIEVIIERNGIEQIVLLEPNQDQTGNGFIGAAVDARRSQIPDELKAELHYAVFPAIGKAMTQVWQFSITTLKSLWGMVIGTVSTDNLGGVISIAQMAGNSAEHGMVSFVGFLAMLSITLGVLNLLPIPVLDGGHLTLFLVEWITGKPVQENVQLMAQRIGIILLLGLMIFAFFNDLSRLFG